MANDEMYDMMMECVKSAKENKPVQYFSLADYAWRDVAIPVITNIITNISMGAKYRVKPEPKTMRVRMYWAKYEFGIKGPHVFKTYNISISFEEISKGIPQFYDWAGDEQILTVPEV